VPYSGEIDESFDFGTANEEEYADLLSVNVEDIRGDYRIERCRLHRHVGF